MSEIQDKLKKWAEEAYDFYLPKARDLHLDFYTQSDLTCISDDKPVELMVIGINPGCGGDFKKGRFACSDDLLKGNVNNGVHENIHEWKITKDVRTILDYASLGHLIDDESTFVLTNATFFSTHDEKGLSGEIKQAQEDSVEYTKSLIKILHPRHIICLGGKSCINLIVKDTTPLLQNLVKLDYGTFDGVPVYGINHTSYFWTAEQKELVGKSLGEAFAIDSEPINAVSFKSKVQYYIKVFEEKLNDRESIKLEPKLRWQYINVCLCNHCEHKLGMEIAEKKDNCTRFFIRNQEGEKILTLSIVNQSKEKKYIGVRYLQENCPKSDNYEEILSKLEKIDDFKPSVNEEGNVIWIGYLNWFKRLKNTDCFIIEAKELLTDIVDRLSEL